MLKTIETSDQKLVLHDRRQGAMFTAIGFLLISLLAMASTLVQGAHRFQMDGGMEMGRSVALLVFLGAELVFVTLATLALITSVRGIRLTFDRSSESVTLERGGLFRPQRRTFSIYAVSHMRLEQSPDGQALALMLVLRSGEQHFVATMPFYAKEQALGLVHAVRAILRQ